MNNDFSNKILRDLMFKSILLLTDLISKLSPAMFNSQSPSQLTFLRKLTAIKSQCRDDLENIKKELNHKKGIMHNFFLFLKFSFVEETHALTKFNFRVRGFDIFKANSNPSQADKIEQLRHFIVERFVRAFDYSVDQMKLVTQIKGFCIQSIKRFIRQLKR